MELLRLDAEKVAGTHPEAIGERPPEKDRKRFTGDGERERERSSNLKEREWERTMQKQNNNVTWNSAVFVCHWSGILVASGTPLYSSSGSNYGGLFCLFTSFFSDQIFFFVRCLTFDFFFFFFWLFYIWKRVFIIFFV